MFRCNPFNEACCTRVVLQVNGVPCLSRTGRSHFGWDQCLANKDRYGGAFGLFVFSLPNGDITQVVNQSDTTLYQNN